MARCTLDSSDWISWMAFVIDAIGTDLFEKRLFEALCYLAPSQATTIFLFPHNGLPSALFERDDDGPWLPQGNVKNYLAGYYLLDPFYQACIDNVASGCYRLTDVAPDHFMRSDFYLAFYQHSHLADEVNFIVHLRPGLTIAVAIASTSGFTKSQIRHLKAIGPWVTAVVRKHWSQLGVKTLGVSIESALARQIHSALNNFGSSVLTGRECMIAQMILRGHSTCSLATRLGVTTQTVKTHRKNIYLKLDISKQSELFSLFINSLAQTRGVFGEDPLKTYLASGG